MSNDKIRVGIIGAGGWAKYGHIPALQTLQEFEIVAVPNRTKATAEKTAAHFNIPHAFGDEQALIDHPAVDLVAIVAPAPEHARLVKAAIAAGKDVYSEWPLSTKTADSEELLALAEAKGETHCRPAAPHGAECSFYARPGEAGLCREDPRCSHDSQRGCFSRDNARNVRVGFPRLQLLECPVGAPTLGTCSIGGLASPKNLTAVIETQFPFFTVAETGQHIPNTNPNEVMAIGTLEGGGCSRFRLRAGRSIALAFRSTLREPMGCSESLTHLPFKIRRITPFK